MYRKLYILVEGDADIRFFEAVIKPILEPGYDWIQVFPYRREKAEWLRKFTQSIQNIGDDYLFVADMDSAPCVTARKQQLLKRYPFLDPSLVRIVCREIESWYLAGLTQSECRRLRMPRVITTTNEITKEQFEKLIPRKYNVARDFMIEILKCYSVETAVTTNVSFRYFLTKLGHTE